MFALRNGEVFRCIFFCLEFVIIAGQDCIEQNAGDCCNSKSGQADVEAADGKINAGNAECAYQNDSSDNQVAALGHIYLVFYDIADTDAGNHTIQNKGNVARVSVFNTGANIPEEDIDKIWDKFYKVDKARTREYGGNGIGLSIVKAVMESSGRGYGVKNHSNGVEFWFELDCKND